MSEQKPSETSYKTMEQAAMGGFAKVMMSNQYKTAEFAFWVIVKANGGQLSFHYLTPQTDGSAHGVSLVMPHGFMIRAYCHTHPGSLKTEHFSPDDLQEFTRLREINPIISFFLLTPYDQIRIAQNEKEFQVSRSVQWLRVKP